MAWDGPGVSPHAPPSVSRKHLCQHTNAWSRAQSHRDMERLLTETEVARDWLNVEPTLLERHRLEGDGPPFIRVSQRVIRYSPSAVQRWLEDRATCRPDAGAAEASS